MCITTAILFAAGATSTGGLVAFAVTKLHTMSGARRIDPTTQIKGGQNETGSKP
jgi:hypothetical protein